MEKIRIWWMNYQKKRYIRRFIKKEVRMLKIGGLTNIKDERIETLTNSIFNASRIVESEVNTKKHWMEKYENDKYFKELKKFIDKQYGGEINSLKRENDKLIADLNESNNKLKKIKRINNMNLSTINE